jgi:uncharacterized membrane protein YbaN (DUF454 family)
MHHLTIAGLLLMLLSTTPFLLSTAVCSIIVVDSHQGGLN